MAWAFRCYEERGRDRLRPQTIAAMEDGQRIPAPDYLAALDLQRTLAAALDPVFARYDALLTPAAPGSAPHGLESTGSSAFNGIWTLCGTPAITVPLLKAKQGLPIGVQLVGRRGDDARLLRTARWLVRRLSTR
jgi:aspartyl-tRNA(Asn)/glutamyl-tRNA(Gln) amidotransferase subunit A